VAKNENEQESLAKCWPRETTRDFKGTRRLRIATSDPSTQRRKPRCATLDAQIARAADHQTGTADHRAAEANLKVRE